VLVGVASVAVSFALPGCQFPNYYVLERGNGEASSAGMGGDPDSPDDGGAGNGASGGTSGSSGNAGGSGGSNGGGGAGGNAGSAGNGGSSGSSVVEPGGAGGAPSDLCPAQACEAALPTDWLGPVALWEGQPGETPPDCPQGYASPIDLHRGLDAPGSNCKCTCAADSQVCQSDVEIYGDQSCGSSCFTPASQQCTAVTSCHGSQGTIQADLPIPSGGSCKPTVVQPVRAAWLNDIRICQADSLPPCEDPSQLCVKTPSPPYTSQTCVMRVALSAQALPECPVDYPNRNELYEKLTDDRACSACTCSPLNGGTCAGKVHLTSTNDCSAAGSDYTMGDGCKGFSLPDYLAHVLVSYTLTPGTCSVATASKPSGKAEASGRPTLVCCQ